MDNLNRGLQKVLMSHHRGHNTRGMKLKAQRRLLWKRTRDRMRMSIVIMTCLLYTSPSPRDKRQSRMPSSA